MATPPISAGARVANTFELLEQILVLASGERVASDEHLLTRLKTNRERKRITSIFACQRVCRAFRDTIANSTPLQAAIFCAHPKENSKAEDSNENPMVRRSALALSAQSHMRIFLSANPFDVVTSVYLSFIFQSFPLRRKSWNAPGSSWRRMFLYAGAYRVESFILQMPSDDPHQAGLYKQYVPVKLSNPTLGQLVDAMYEALGWEPWME
ncbi:uncharacterized protein MYCFIDRAFT_209083 [Pseudocercospora fijiensis CIRAD86]|uniref:F-box domain-containing protein n=1 Tax=Pseudocercospora fijiensis (strain CIRAD86) TaxID=383855 RepID=M3A2X5_PSEFD|nr:uncharacterized protein MYCFIDRAFT_209083 [Pseudocercospora fijiensis CIRAD86]EME78851.1 hypothetical protein MYCFIDRAFT_209083 [Pseudocercospora fijiensis CIRAD86]